MRDSGHEKTLPRVKYCFVLYKSLSDVNKTAVQREDGKMTQAEQKKELRKQMPIMYAVLYHHYIYHGLGKYLATILNNLASSNIGGQ